MSGEDEVSRVAAGEDAARAEDGHLSRDDKPV